MNEELTGLFTYEIIRECYADLCRILKREIRIIESSDYYFVIAVMWNECRQVDKYLNEE